MKAWDIIGYAADADVWCPACAQDAYGPLTSDTQDQEGNPVHPIFAMDEWEYLPVCTRCQETLID